MKDNWIRAMKRVTWPTNNSVYNAHGDTPGKPESKRHAVDHLKVSIGLCDSCHSFALLNLLRFAAVIRISFNDFRLRCDDKGYFWGSCPHLYVLEVWPDEIVFKKIIFSCVRAIFFRLQVHCLSRSKKKKTKKNRDTFLKTLFSIL